MVEHSTDTRGVPGSNPGTRTESSCGYLWYNTVIMNQQNKTTPKDFFYHLTATIALYAGIIALINLSFSVINYYFPDALAGYFYANTVAWPISMLIVLVPILYVLEWLIKKDIRSIPEKAEIWVRRWRIYLTLFLTGAVIAGDLVVLINTYLNGEISSRFVFKVLAIIIILGIVFAYYILEKINPYSKVKATLSYIGFAIVAVAIVSGFIAVGSPTKQRNMRFDSQRVYDLQNIQSQVVSYWQQKGELPTTLENLKDPLSYSVIPVDPENKTSYVYSRKGGPFSFELCATFALPYEDTQGKGSYGYGQGGMYTTRAYPSPIGLEDNWKHQAGLSCFTRTIDTEKYPPTPKPLTR